ncbi:MAG: histidine--tRNA ligase [Oscillospiraceae bacterium]|nr:histidine--tRNA ligase [Oscillospiraceae bacterium]
MEKITAPRGTKDVLPSGAGEWAEVERAAAETAGAYGYGRIRFPTFEYTELFVRGVGGATDIVRKEMYTFEDKGGRSISLRPEGTASVVRAGVEHGLFGGAMPLKAYYIAPNFRYEKPQSGRLREHHQFGVECFGASGPEADAEVIALGRAFLRRAGVDGLSLKLNSIGCSGDGGAPGCRPAYRERLIEFLTPMAGELCADCRERMIRSPLRVLDCKAEVCRAATAGAPEMSECLCAHCDAHRKAVERYLTLLGIPYENDGRLVRGLDYYNRTVFEFTAGDGEAAHAGTVLGGGRYDGLVEQLGGPATPACGFGCGLERVLLARGGERAPKGGPALFMAIAGEPGSPADIAARLMTDTLRAGGIWSEQELCGRSLKAQLKHADRMGARYVMVIGDSEVESARAELKRMSDGARIPCAMDTGDITAAIGKDAL